MFYTDLIRSHQREATLQERGQGWEGKGRCCVSAGIYELSTDVAKVRGIGLCKAEICFLYGPRRES